MRFQFVKKLIVKKHVSLIKEWMAEYLASEIEEDFKQEVISNLTNSLMYTQDKIIRNWIDAYYDNTHEKILLKIKAKLSPDHPFQKVKSTRVNSWRYLINYLRW